MGVEENDHDSAFSTKANLDDLKKGGRRVRRDSDANYLCRIQELEEQKKEEEMDAMMHKMSSNNEASPEAVRKSTREGASSPKDSTDGAPAGVK